MVDEVSNVSAGRTPGHTPDYTEAVSHVERSSESRSASQSRDVDNASVEVTLSAEAQLLQRARQAVEEAPDVREALVDQIRAEVEAGNYQVDVEHLVGQLLPLFGE